MSQKRIIQILLPCLILVAVVGIFVVKNQGRIASSQDQPAVESSSPPGNQADEDIAQADFSLLATEAIDFETLSAHGLPVIIDYGSDSCIPCKEMAPVLETMNEEMTGKAFIKFVDVWKYTDAANNVPVQVIPTQVLVNADGTPFVPSEELAQTIEFTLYSSRETDEHVFTVHQGGMTEEQMRLILAEMGVEE